MCQIIDWLTESSLTSRDVDCVLPAAGVQATIGANCVAEMCKAMCAPKSCAINGFVGAVLCFGLLIFAITEKCLGSTMIWDLSLFLDVLPRCGITPRRISTHVAHVGRSVSTCAWVSSFGVPVIAL